MQAPVASRSKAIPEVYQWTPDHLIAHMKASGRRLGMVVDLTFTSRYYDPVKAFKHAHVRYLKLQSRGHGEVPSAEVVNKFFYSVLNAQRQFAMEWQQVPPLSCSPCTCFLTASPSAQCWHSLQEKTFLQQYDDEVAGYNRAMSAITPTERKPEHPDSKLNETTRRTLRERALVGNGPKVVAVHCTHGFNRSGYVMIHFAKRRQPGTPLQTLIKRCALAPCMRRPAPHTGQFPTQGSLQIQRLSATGHIQGRVYPSPVRVLPRGAARLWSRLCACTARACMETR